MILGRLPGWRVLSQSLVNTVPEDTLPVFGDSHPWNGCEVIRISKADPAPPIPVTRPQEMSQRMRSSPTTLPRRPIGLLGGSA